MATPFDDSSLMTWLLFAPESVAESPVEVATIGWGPISRSEFEDALTEWGINTGLPLSDVDAVVVGRSGWNQEDMAELLTEKAGQPLKVYSQEMFLAYIISNTDPFDADSDVLDTFGLDHPALEYLSDYGFNWQEVRFIPGHGNLDEFDSPRIGVLRRMGYRVGRSGEDDQARRVILTRVMELDNLPFVQSDAHMDEWGPPRSCKRLEKMAHSIKAFAESAARRSNPPKEAIEDWLFDHGWLKVTYYQQLGCKFRWPGIET